MLVQEVTNLATDSTLADAQEIGAQLQTAMEDLYYAHKMSSPNPTVRQNIDLLQKSIRSLNQELNVLGYKYAPTVPGLVAKLGTRFVEDEVDEGWGGAIAGAVGGGVIGALIGHPWAGTALGAWLGSWLSKSDAGSTPVRSLYNYRAYVNGKEIEPEWGTDEWLDYDERDGLLSKEQAVQAIVSAAEKEHNRKTQYTIVNAQTGQVVFRKYWSDQVEDDYGHQVGTWQDVEHQEITPPTPSKPQRIEPTLDSPPVAPKSPAPTSTQTTTKVSGPADFSKRGFTGYKKPGDVDEGFRVANQQIPGTNNRAQSAYYPTNVKPQVPKLDKPLTDQELARLSQLAGIKNK
jgi:hypothetical protein